ncbi:hypothetical protein LWI29_016952 [Acer saccharum]|uniref:DUF7081 domain-containing protein n=1 Tax=Acer saccharum TaxID=4024 RepID=A0AA39TL25_ACESA|nr:hypothetical protein LWI29_016952 [Acer saccharum]
MPGPINVSNPIDDANNFLMPVAPFEAGEGLPYAPMDWPNPSDNWGWRVGKRIDNLGYYTERFIYLPRHIQRTDVPRRHFNSKLALERYLKSEFSNADIEGFFAGFSWKVPSSLSFALNRRASKANAIISTMSNNESQTPPPTTDPATTPSDPQIEIQTPFQEVSAPKNNTLIVN